ncbi:MAG TPA: ATP-binding protein, partial [Gemmatimonadaceae bacterium]
MSISTGETARRPITFDVSSETTLAAVYPKHLRQLLSALISNALKYADESLSPRVEVFDAVPLRLKEDTIMLGALDLDATPHVCVAVTDEGIGITPEALPHIFDRFYRVPETVEWSGLRIGMGIGLYLSKHIVELHGVAHPPT